MKEDRENVAGETSESEAAGTRAHDPNKSLRILVVEDHDDTRHTLSRLLSHFGHEIEVAENTQNASLIVQRKTFDVLLCDIGLPDGTGYEVVSLAKQMQPLKGVALTAFGSAEDVRRGKEAGFDFHLTKPVDFHELRTVLAQISA